MKVRALIRLSLILCIGATQAAAGARFADRTERGHTAPAPSRQERHQLTAAEQNEARGFARTFAARLRETRDVTPLVDEMFVDDFGERLRHDREAMFMIRRDVLAAADGTELRRFFVAQLNFFTLALAYWMSRPQGSGAGDAEGVAALERMYPPEVSGVLRGDPHLTAYITGTGDASAAGAGGADDEGFVTSSSAMRELASTMERAAEALRPHVPPSEAPREARGSKTGDEDDAEVETAEGETREEPFYGFAPGTRFVHMKVAPLRGLNFELHATKVAGRLKIVSLIPLLED